MKYNCEFTEAEFNQFNAVLDELPLKYARPLLNLFNNKFKTEQDENKKPDNPSDDSSDDSMQVLQGEEDANDKA